MVMLQLMAEDLARNWWVLLLRGIVALLFAFFTFTQPGITLATLVLVFGAFCLAEGALGVWTALSQREHVPWGLFLLWGLLGIGVGLMTLFAPGVTALALVFYIAVWAISTGVLEIASAIRLRQAIEGEWLLVLAGVVSVIFGVLLMVSPGRGALAVVWLIGMYAAAFGFIMIALSFKVRRFARRIAA
jgi:uncharacterized membrane protein HdeD (DUF308 family)